MPTFTPMSNGERSVITANPDLLHGEAETWLDAKAALGFDLTPLQAQMLPFSAPLREAIQRRSA